MNSVVRASQNELKSLSEILATVCELESEIHTK